MTQPVGIDDIRRAARRIANHVNHTPVMSCDTLSRMAGVELCFKCEQFQKVGAFKFRGACNAVFALDDATAERGVVTHSSGNHAQALALAARLRGISAHIVMPSTASAVKRAAVADYGATITDCEPSLSARETAVQNALEATGGTLIHPYNNLQVIAGQGTVAIELLAKAPTLDAIVAPVGGGGLVSGVCLAAKDINPSIRIFAAEPTGADDAARSLAAGELIPQTNPQTIADGLLTSLGSLTWPVIREHVEKVITVDEEEIVMAMQLAWQRAKFLIEPSAAVAVAAVLSEQFKALSGLTQVGVVLSGGNVDLERLPW